MLIKMIYYLLNVFTIPPKEKMCRVHIKPTGNFSYAAGVSCNITHKDSPKGQPFIYTSLFTQYF